MNPRLSLVIPTTGSDCLWTLLASIEIQTLSPRPEVFVVCNPARPSVRDKISAYPGVHYLDCEPGANRARNAGWARAPEGWVYFLDDDVVLPRADHLERARDVVAARADADVIGGPYLKPSAVSPAARVYHFLQDAWFGHGYRNPKQWVHLLGGNLILRKDGSAPGPFDPVLIFGGTETEMLARFEDQGKILVRADEIAVEHDPRVTWSSFTEKLFRQGMAAGVLARRHPARDEFLFQSPAPNRWLDRVGVEWGLGVFRAGVAESQRDPRSHFTRRRMWRAILSPRRFRAWPFAARWPGFLSFRRQITEAQIDSDALRAQERER